MAIPPKVWVIPGTSSSPSKPVNGVPTVNIFRADGGDDGAGESFVAFGDFWGWRATGFSARIEVVLHPTIYAKKPTVTISRVVWASKVIATS